MMLPELHARLMLLTSGLEPERHCSQRRLAFPSAFASAWATTKRHSRDILPQLEVMGFIYDD